MILNYIHDHICEKVKADTALSKLFTDNNILFDVIAPAVTEQPPVEYPAHKKHLHFIMSRCTAVRNSRCSDGLEVQYQFVLSGFHLYDPKFRDVSEALLMFVSGMRVIPANEGTRRGFAVSPATGEYQNDLAKLSVTFTIPFTVSNTH